MGKPEVIEAAKEAKAIETCGKLLAALNKGGRKRVLEWLWDSFGSRTERERSTAGLPQGGERGTTRDRIPPASKKTGASDDYSKFEELFEAAGAKTEVDRALLAGYWLQFRGDAGAGPAESFTSAEANQLLHSIGHRIAHVGRAFQHLRDRRQGQGAWVVTVGAKKGDGRLKVTPTGKKRVETMLSGDPGADD